MSNIKGVHRKEEQCNGLLTINQGRMSSYYVEYGRHVARLRRRRRRRRRAYVPTSNTASHDNHEKINSWVSYMSMGLRLAALLAAGAPLETKQRFQIGVV